MKRITPLEVCVEAVITRHGTLVGPYVASLVGHPELTPYKGGWCGNDIYPTVLSKKQRERALDDDPAARRRLAQEGYRGFFEVDYLRRRRHRRAVPGRAQPAGQRRCRR